jgi:hypothetical protein
MVAGLRFLSSGFFTFWIYLDTHISLLYIQIIPKRFFIKQTGLPATAATLSIPFHNPATPSFGEPMSGLGADPPSIRLPFPYEHHRKLYQLALPYQDLSGCGRGSACPANVETRKQTTSFLARAFSGRSQEEPPIADQIGPRCTQIIGTLEDNRSA